MFVRTAGSRDLAALRDLLAETWHAAYDGIYGRERVDDIVAVQHSAEALRRDLDRPDSEFVLADDGNAIAGMAYANAADGGRTIILRQLYVRPASQGSGIGGMLLDEIEASFHEAKTIRLEVAEANAKALAFFVAQGFVEAGRVAAGGEAAPGIAALVLERPLLRTG